MRCLAIVNLVSLPAKRVRLTFLVVLSSHKDVTEVRKAALLHSALATWLAAEVSGPFSVTDDAAEADELVGLFVKYENGTPCALDLVRDAVQRALLRPINGLVGGQDAVHIDDAPHERLFGLAQEH